MGKTTEEYAKLFLREGKHFEDFCSENKITAQGQRDALSRLIETATSSDLGIFKRKLLLPRQFLSGFDEKGRFYHGTYIASPTGEPEPVIIMDDGTIIREPFFAEAGLKFKELPAVEDASGTFGWAGEQVEEFIKGVRNNKPAPTLSEIYPKLREYFAVRGYFLDSGTPTFLALWSAGTHIGQIPTLPRPILEAPPNTGKSQNIRAIRGVVAYPVLATDPSKPALFRLACGQTILIDNFDKLDEEQKAGIVHFSETTFEGDGATYRVEDNGKRKIPTRFAAKVPIVFGGIADDAYSDALRSRSVGIRLEKAPQEVYIAQVPEIGSEPEATELRNLLYLWGMHNARRLRKAFLELKPQDRHGKIKASVGLLAKEIGPEVEKEVCDWLDAHIYREEIAEYSEQGQCLSALWELLERNIRPVQVLEVAVAWATANGILERDEGRANPNYKRELNKLSQKAAKYLRTIPSAKQSKPHGKSVFSFRKEPLLRYLRRFGIIEPEQTTLETTPNTPNNPNTTNPPNTPNLSISETPSNLEMKTGLGVIGDDRGGSGRKEWGGIQNIALLGGSTPAKQAGGGCLFPPSAQIPNKGGDGNG